VCRIVTDELALNQLNLDFVTFSKVLDGMFSLRMLYCNSKSTLTFYCTSFEPFDSLSTNAELLKKNKLIIQMSSGQVQLASWI